MKNALLALFSKDTLIKVLAFFFHSITPEMWDAAKSEVERVERAVNGEGKGGEKFDLVFQSLALDFPALRTAALNWLIETAVSYALASLRK